MNQTLAIILAFFCAFHGVVDGNPIAANLDHLVLKATEPDGRGIAALTCYYVFSLKPEIAMRTECTTTGKLKYIT